jgi:hypothetical protein
MLLGQPTIEQHALISRTGPESMVQEDTTLFISPIIPYREYGPAVDADLKFEISLPRVPCGIEDMPGRMPSQNACTIQGERTTPIRDGDRLAPSGGAFNVHIGFGKEYSPSPITPHTSFEFSDEVGDGLDAAAVLLVEGLHEQAFSVYSHWWKVTWAACASGADSAALAFLVSIASGMSRSASTLSEVLDTGSKMKQLIPNREEPSVGFGPKAALILHTYLAVLLLRLQWMYEAWDHLEYALKLIDRRLTYGGPVLGDWCATANLLCQIAVRFPHQFRSSAGEKLLKELESYQMRWLRVERQHDQLLQRLFHWCVSVIDLAELNLRLAEQLSGNPDQGCHFPEIRTALHLCLFRHLWQNFARKRAEAIELETYEIQYVHQLSEMMQVGCVDLFAAIALALIDLASPLPDVEKQRLVNATNTSAWSSILLEHIYDTALVHLLEERSLKWFIEWFLAAHASITLVRVAKQSPSASADPQSSFVRESLRMSIASGCFE